MAKAKKSAKKPAKKAAAKKPVKKVAKKAVKKAAKPAPKKVAPKKAATPAKPANGLPKPSSKPFGMDGKALDLAEVALVLIFRLDDPWFHEYFRLAFFVALVVLCGDRAESNVIQPV